MKEFLKKIKLIDHLTTELEIQKNEFVSILKRHVDEERKGMFAHTFEAFHSSENDYRGQVSNDGFQIRKRVKLFSSPPNMAVAKGTFRQKDAMLIIETEVNGFSKLFIPIYIYALVFYSFFIISDLMRSTTNSEGELLNLTFLVLHALLFFLIPYFLMRRSTKIMKHELEREFFFLSKKVN